MSDDSVYYVFMGFILIVSAFSWYFDWPEPFTDKRTVYFVECPYGQSTKEGCKVPEVGQAVTYKALAEIQEVISLTATGVAKMDDCTVFDRNNWACGKNHPKVMRNGEFHQVLFGNEYPETNELFWLRAKIDEWLGS